TQFAWDGTVRAFGQSWPANGLPRWYALVWFPVALAPPAAMVAVVGLIRCFRRLPPASHPFPLQMRRGPVDLSLRRWLAAHAALFWLGVLVLRPTLYDEDRHLLFLLPPVLVLAALALDACGARVKNAVALLVAVTSLASYAEWGRYAYVYKSPLIG